MIDSLAQRYGCLPTDLLDRATDWDVRVAMVSQRWHREQEEQQSGKKKAATPDVNTLQSMMDRVRKQNG
jgi:hypothetical protein